MEACGSAIRFTVRQLNHDVQSSRREESERRFRPQQGVSDEVEGL